MNQINALSIYIVKRFRASMPFSSLYILNLSKVHDNACVKSLEASGHVKCERKLKLNQGRTLQKQVLRKHFSNVRI